MAEANKVAMLFLEQLKLLVPSWGRRPLRAALRALRVA